MADQSREHWHLDKRVPLALILLVLTHTGFGVWWAATKDAENRYLTGRVDRLESSVSKNDELVRTIEQRLAKIEAYSAAQADATRELLKAFRSGWPGER